MLSIRRALTGTLLAGSLFAVVLAGIASSLAVEKLVRREFDRSLLAKAELLATLTEQDHGRVTIEFADEYLPEFSTADPREYFELWAGDGRVVERSRSLARKSLIRPPRFELAPRFSDLVLPDGRAGRQVQLGFVPQTEGDDVDPDPSTPNTSGPRALLAVARGTQDLDRLVLALYGIQLATALAIALGIGLIVRRGVTRGLAPLADLARQVESLGSERLASRFAVDPPIEELVPIVARLNDLFARLEQAFARERQFSANVAHELRTPIAELKSLAEVGSRWPNDPSVAGPFFADALAIADRMERTTDQLLALARAEAGLEIVVRERVGLAELVEACWAPFAATAAERGLAFDREIAAGSALTTDRTKLERILSNLLANAVEHSPAGSRIACSADRDSKGALHLEVSNLAPQLEPDDLALLFVRFWRKDPARTGSEHSGLGLAVARSLADLLAFDLTAHLSAEGRLAVRLDEVAAGP